MFNKKNEDYIARLRQPLKEHLEEVSKMAGNFASKIGLKNMGKLSVFCMI